MISDATTIAELAEILERKGVRGLRLSLDPRSEGRKRVLAQAESSTLRMAPGLHGRSHWSRVSATVDAEDDYTLHGALTRLLGALPDDEKSERWEALAKAGAR